MPTETDRLEFARLATGGGPVVNVIKMPKLSDYLVPVLPHTGRSINAYDDAMEVWRKSILFDSTRSASSVLEVGVGDTGGVETPEETVTQYHALLDANLHTDTVLRSPVRGDIVVANDAARWDALAIGTAGYFLRSNGSDPSWQPITVDDVTLPEALTAISDTNVTIALGGSPLVALLAATSITLGWNGVLSLLRGGTNEALTAVAGAVVWCDADSFGLTAAGTAGQVLVAQGTASPIWQDASVATAHTILSATHTDTLTASVLRGDIITGQAATPKWTRLAVGVEGQTILKNDAVDVFWGQVNLASADVGGVLTVQNGGTGAASFPPFSVIVSGAVSTDPLTVVSGVGTAGQVLTSNGAGTLPTWQSLTSDTHNLLSATHPDTTAASVVRGDLVTGQTATPKWQRLAFGAAFTVLRTAAGTEPSWGKVDLEIDVIQDLPIANGGTNSAVALVNNRVMVSSFGQIRESVGLETDFYGNLYVIPDAIASGVGAPVALTVTGAAHTNLDSTTEAIDIHLNLGRTVTFGGGVSISTQRAMVIAAPTYAFGVATIIDKAATLAITDAPQPGLNATITNGYALWVQAGITRLGMTSVGVATPTAQLHVRAGQAGAGLAAFKFNSGVTLTAAEAGAVEWDGSRLYITQTSGPTRQTIAYLSDLTAYAPVDATFVTLSTNATLANERVLTGTANRITVTDGGAGAAVTLSTPQDIDTGANVEFARLTLSDKLVLPNLTPGSVLFIGASNEVAENNASLFWDNSSHWIKISGAWGATNTPGLILNNTSEILVGNRVTVAFWQTNSLATISETAWIISECSSFDPDYWDLSFWNNAGGGEPNKYLTLAADAGNIRTILFTRLVFEPDNTFDIGEAAAVRPRDLFLGRNLVVGGTADVTSRFATLATSPAQITADQNDYAIGAGTFFRLSTDASRTITGMTGGTDGKWMVIANVGSFNLVLANQNASSTTTNRIITGTGASITIAPDEQVRLIYDASDGRWRCGPKVFTGGAGANHALLDGSVHTDTAVDAVTRGSIIVGNATPLWDELALGAAGKLLRSDGTDLLYSTFTIPDTFAQGDVIYASATNVLTALVKDANATRYLSNTGTTNNPAWAQVNLANGVSGDLPFANLTQGSALSVFGVTGNAIADMASIVAGSDFQVLRRSGTAVAFGSVNLASTNAVTGTLPVGNGGTGATAFTQGSVIFAGASGVYTQNNAKLFWNNTTNTLSVNGVINGVAEFYGVYMAMVRNLGISQPMANFTNNVDADFQMAVTQGGVGDKYAMMFSSTSTGLALGTAGVERVRVTAAGILNLGVASTRTGGLAFAHASSANLTSFQAGNATAAVTYTLPTADGTTGQFLQTNGSAVLSWSVPKISRLWSEYLNAGNSASTETTLDTVVIASGKFPANLDFMEFTAVGYFGGLNTKRIKIKYDSDLIFDSGSLSIGVTSYWRIQATLYRVNSSLLESNVILWTTLGVIVQKTDLAYDLNSGFTLTLTGESIDAAGVALSMWHGELNAA